MRKKTLLITAVMIFLFSGMQVFGQTQPPVSWNDPLEQWSLVKFSHSLHIGDVGAECTQCHANAETSTSSQDLLLPKMAACSDCHEIEDENECKTCHVDEERLEPFQQPDRPISFNHKVHIDQGVACTTCHKGIEQAEAPSNQLLPAMATCTTCHDGKKAVNTCENCHSQIETRLPLSHKQTDWIKEHKRVVKVGSLANDCTSCHSDNFCQTCHAEVNLQMTKGKFLRPVPPNRPMPSGKQVLVKQNVHDLNFLFVHPIDFRTKRSDCFSCHDQQTFCQDCHSKNQDAGFPSPMPLSHRVPDFTRIGAGSGGGQHAILAKKDIESCAACHDVEGSDPACITCHVDRTPGLGNDPKTHPANFRHDEGDWHNNSGSVCFQCHTNTQKAGIGFCGYCHGVK